MNEIIDTFTAEVVPKYDKLTKGKYTLDRFIFGNFLSFLFLFFSVRKIFSFNFVFTI